MLTPAGEMGWERMDEGMDGSMEEYLHYPLIIEHSLCVGDRTACDPGVPYIIHFISFSQPSYGEATQRHSPVGEALGRIFLWGSLSHTSESLITEKCVQFVAPKKGFLLEVGSWK